MGSSPSLSRDTVPTNTNQLHTIGTDWKALYQWNRTVSRRVVDLYPSFSLNPDPDTGLNPDLDPGPSKNFSNMFSNPN
jgi:hypothetical protein